MPTSLGAAATLAITTVEVPTFPPFIAHTLVNFRLAGVGLAGLTTAFAHQVSAKEDTIWLTQQP